MWLETGPVQLPTMTRHQRLQSFQGWPQTVFSHQLLLSSGQYLEVSRCMHGMRTYASTLY